MWMIWRRPWRGIGAGEEKKKKEKKIGEYIYVCIRFLYVLYNQSLPFS